jgi:Uma2 family endonuclease
MSTVANLSADDLLAMPRGTGVRHELVEGELREMSPTSWRHGEVVANINEVVGGFIRAHGLGRSYGADTGFWLERDPDTVRAPDFAFIAKDRLPIARPTEAYWPGPPDLAVEVLSPNDRMGEVNEKIDAWLAAGCRAVWVVDPRMETIAIYRSRADVRLFTSGQMLLADPEVAGFACPVHEIFR